MADPTAQEILDWALINRSRLDPAGEAVRSNNIDLNEGPPTDGNGNVITLTAASKQPLAWNNALYAVADQHSLDMFNNLPGKTWLTGLYHNPQATHEANLTKAGYSFSWWGENVSESLPLTATYNVTQGIYDQLKSLFFDNFANNATYRRGHRVNILNDNFQEVGVGEFTGTFGGETRSLITEDYGRPSAGGQFLTGIAYNDGDGDKFYSVGEGRANMSVATSGGTAVTATAGNYSRAIAAGDQTITFSGSDLAAPVTVTATIVAGRNALIDMVGQSTVETSASLTAGSGVTKIIGLGNFGLTLTGNGLANTIVTPLGTNTLNGAGGVDTAVFADVMANYQVKTNADGTVTVTGVGLNDTLISIENLQFKDKTIPTVPQADLTVSSISAAASVVQGSKLDLSYVVSNLGTAAAGAHSAGINVDAAVDATHSVASNAVNALAAGAQSTLTNSIDTSNLAVGQHTLFIKEDWQNAVGESDESNNSKSITFTVTAAPTKADLAVSSITAAASVVQGSKLDLSYVVGNLGGTAAGAHSAGINIDAAVDATHSVASNAVNSLAANAQSTLTNSIDTSNLAVGQHTLYIKEDWQNAVGESDETNNSKSITFTVTAAPTKADVVVNSISAAASVRQGDKLDLSYVVSNLGNAAAGLHYVGVNVDAAVDESHYLAWNTVNSLAGNAQSTLTGSLDTTNLALGKHTLYIKEDFWQNAVDESNETNNSKSITFNVTAASRPAHGDFNGDGTSDILFRNNANGAAWVAEMDQGALANWSSLGSSSTSYRAVGVGDFNGDGTADVLVRNNASGDTWFAEVSDGNFAGWHQVGGSNTAFSVVGVGDFYGSGTSDFLVRNNATGDTWFGEMSDGNFAGWHQIGASNTAFSVAGVGDFNGDGTDDILFRNNATGDNWFAQMNDGALQGWHQIGGSNSAFSVAGVGDFNGDGTDDILFRNNATGDNWFAQMNDGALQGWHQIGGSNPAFAVAAVGDYDGNGTSDILFRNNASGDTWFAAMNNGALDGWHQVTNADPSYSVIRT